MIRGLLIILVLLGITLAGVYGAGSALPDEIITVRVAHYRTNIEKIWTAISDYEALPTWNDSILSSRQLPNMENDNLLWHLQDKQGGSMVLEVRASASHVLHHVALVENDYPFTGSWEFELAPKGTGTMLRLRETAHIPNPFIRFLRYYVIGMDIGMHTYMEELADHFLEKIEVKERLL